MNSLNNLLNSASGNKVRYGIVGLGSISQEAMMPGVKHTGNSEITAIVTSDAVKAKELGEKYGDVKAYTYEQFDSLLDGNVVDALYIATPNWRHAEFAVPALRRGIHVLLEKPMEVTAGACKQIISAQEETNAKLMIAYRLHFEPATIWAIEKVRSGQLGEVHLFSSVFCQSVDPSNHRVKNGVLAGPLFDMGPYPINGARNLFEDEPIDVLCVASRHRASGYVGLDDTVSLILRFPGERLAQFTISYFGNATDEYSIIGSEGAIRVSPGFTYGKSLEAVWTLGEKKDHQTFKNTDHFGGEMKYFSGCILTNKDPEPDGMEGLADVYVIEAALRSLTTGRFEQIERITKRARIGHDQIEKLSAESTPEMVHASSPARGKEKNAKN